MNAVDFLKKQMTEGSIWEKKNYFPVRNRKTMKCIYVRNSKVLDGNGFTLVPESYQGHDTKTNFQKFETVKATMVDDTTAAFTMYDKSLKTNVVVYTLTLKNSIQEPVSCSTK